MPNWDKLKKNENECKKKYKIITKFEQDNCELNRQTGIASMKFQLHIHKYKQKGKKNLINIKFFAPNNKLASRIER